ncbi:hypothetical protein PBOI14_59050 [Pseudomonas sp. Boi14]|nr:hypothetical protein PBOI14_59050 [Pseudomonas sp. Boi14]
MQAVDFNSDMGESFGPWTIGDGVDNELMGFISSANIATGFHAGDPGTMRRTIEQAKRLGVAIGAHPGFRDLVGFGRRHINAPPRSWWTTCSISLAPCGKWPGTRREAAAHQASWCALHAPGPGRGSGAAAGAKPAPAGARVAAVLHAQFGDLAGGPGTGAAGDPRVLRRPRLRPQRLHRVYPQRPRPGPGSRGGQGAARLPDRPGTHRRRRGAVSRIRFHLPAQRHPGALDLVQATRAALDQAGIEVRAPR